MLKRILTIAAGVMLGLALSVGTAHFAALWGLWPGSELDRSVSQVRTVLKLVNENYVSAGNSTLPRLTDEALRGLVGSLDPHSEFMTAKDYQALNDELNSEFGGIGVQVELQKGHVMIIAPIAGSPSERGGVERGDEIVSVGGEPLSNPSMTDIVDRLHGKPGTTVTVGFHRADPPKEYSLKLTREQIRVDSVRGVKLLPGHIGYLQLTQFTEHSGEEFGLALKRLKAGGMTALILDLRNNPGGLLTAAVAVAGPFFPQHELIVYTQGRQPDDREEYRSESPGPPLTLPLIVLINAGSASAAEIVAGALKDTHRAVIVGERSFGKGSVQSIFPLADGEGLRLTVARYYTPSGVTIHEHGVTPDVESVMTPEEDRNVLLQQARGDVTDPKEFKARFNLDPVPDRQLDTAIAVLQAAQLLKDRSPVALQP